MLKQYPVIILWILVLMFLGMISQSLLHTCPEPTPLSHVECRIGASFESGKLFRANVAFSDTVDQLNEANKALGLCEGGLMPIGGGE